MRKDHARGTPLQQVRMVEDNARRCLAQAREGCYGRAVRALQSRGVAVPGNDRAFLQLSEKHPSPLRHPSQHPLAKTLPVTTEEVLAGIQAFPRATSPGWSQLRVQHLMECICGCTSPCASECAVELTRWVNLLEASVWQGQPSSGPVDQWSPAN